MMIAAEEREIHRRRAAARRTAWRLALLVAIIFGAFVLSGVIGR